MYQHTLRVISRFAVLICFLQIGVYAQSEGEEPASRIQLSEVYRAILKENVTEVPIQDIDLGVIPVGETCRFSCIIDNQTPADVELTIRPSCKCLAVESRNLKIESNSEQTVWFSIRTPASPQDIRVVLNLLDHRSKSISKLNVSAKIEQPFESVPNAIVLSDNAPSVRQIEIRSLSAWHTLQTIRSLTKGVNVEPAGFSDAKNKRNATIQMKFDENFRAERDGWVLLHVVDSSNREHPIQIQVERENTVSLSPRIVTLSPDQDSGLFRGIVILRGSNLVDADELSLRAVTAEGGTFKCKITEQTRRQSNILVVRFDATLEGDSVYDGNYELIVAGRSGGQLWEGKTSLKVRKP